MRGKYSKLLARTTISRQKKKQTTTAVFENHRDIVLVIT